MHRFTWLLLLGLAFGCDEKKEAPHGAGSALGAKASAAVSARPAPPPAPWYVGTWQGTYDAQQYVIQMTKKQGAVKAWTRDGGTDAGGEGQGKVTLKIDESKTITGEASGPLGDMTASGQVDEEQFRVRLTPKEPGERVFQGFFLAKKSGEAMSGRLQASTGDSITVRDAPVKLEKKSGEAASAP